MSEPRDCCWGLRFRGTLDPSDLNVGSSTWTVVDLSVVVAGDAEVAPFVTDERAALPLAGGGFARIDRLQGSAELVLPVMPSQDELIHPLLASTSAIMNTWLGRICVHAGCAVVGGVAWAFAGERTSGKSTMLAWFARQGYEVITDDVLVIDGGTVYPGPRVLDLREGAASWFGMGRDLGPGGTRERWRVRLEDAAPSRPLAGFVFLEWSDGPPALERLEASGSLERLFEHLSLAVPPDPHGMLELAAFPAWRWRRPRDWGALDEAGGELVAALERFAATAPPCDREPAPASTPGAQASSGRRPQAGATRP